MSRPVIPPRSSSPGFGLVELIVALTILSIGLLALTGVVAVAQRSFAGAEALEEGADMAALVLDSLMLEAAPAPGERQQGRTLAHWTVHADSIATVVELTVHIEGGRGRPLSFRASRHTR